MKILIINNAEKGILDFVNPIASILKNSQINSEIIDYADISNTNLDEYDGIILSASPRGNDIVDHHLPYYDWIKTCNKPILGICAGHQIIGKLFGSKLSRDVEREVGEFGIVIDKDDPIFEGYEDKILVKQNHNDSITLPEDFILLACSDRCRVQVMRHKSKAIYTTEFHAELLNKKLILNFIKIAQKP